MRALLLSAQENASTRAPNAVTAHHRICNRLRPIRKADSHFLHSITTPVLTPSASHINDPLPKLELYRRGNQLHQPRQQMHPTRITMCKPLLALNLQDHLPAVRP